MPHPNHHTQKYMFYNGYLLYTNLLRFHVGTISKFQETRIQASRPAEVPIKSLERLNTYKLNLGNLGIPHNLGFPQTKSQYVFPNFVAEIWEILGKEVFMSNSYQVGIPLQHPVLFLGDNCCGKLPTGDYRAAKRLNATRQRRPSPATAGARPRILVSIVARSKKRPPPKKKGNTAMKIYENGECNFDHLIFGGM